MKTENIKRAVELGTRIEAIDGALNKISRVRSTQYPDDREYNYSPEKFDLIIVGACTLDLQEAKVGPEILHAIKRELTTIKEKLLKEVEEL